MVYSRLREIYKAIEETHVEIANTPVRVRGLDNLTTAVNRANLPLRILLPVGSNAAGRNLNIITADGSGRSGIWTIPEIMFRAAVSQGQGLEEYAGDLVDYVVNFEQAILERRTSYVGFIHTNLSLDTGEFEWPSGSNVWYFGVRAVHTVGELI